MNDRKVKGKPHIEAWQWAAINDSTECNLGQRVCCAFAWDLQPQGYDFWCDVAAFIWSKGK